MKKTLLVLSGFVALGFLCQGCDETVIDIPKTNVSTSVVQVEKPNQRFTVEYQGTFEAAYMDRAQTRSIYIVKDSKTGVEYLAIEGCGTAQLAMQGKVLAEQ